MSRAPASAAFTSGTSFAASTNAAASPPDRRRLRLGHDPLRQRRSPRSRAIIARVRRFGLNGRYRSSSAALVAHASIFARSSSVSCPCSPIDARIAARRSSSSST
jgi:hypothetical protein